MLTTNYLIDSFPALGLAKGDTVLIHSSLRRLGRVDGRADGVIEALLHTVGPQGTAAVPTHTWGTVNDQQPVFHQTLSPSIVGALTNVFRQRPDALRSLHPTHSVAAIGLRAAELIAGHELDDTPCSRRSPYGKLAEWGGKILFIGVGLECCTFFHGCEEWAGCPWLFSPDQEMLYSIAADGEVIPAPSWRHTSDFPRRFTALEPALREIGALHTGEIGGCPLLLLDARPAADWLVDRLRVDPWLVVDRNAE